MVTEVGDLQLKMAFTFQWIVMTPLSRSTTTFQTISCFIFKKPFIEELSELFPNSASSIYLGP